MAIKARYFLIIFLFLISLCMIETVSASWAHLSSKNMDMPAPGISTEQTASLILDVDRDGINDFIMGSRKTGSSIVWFKRNSGGWTKYLIEKDTLPIEAGGAFHDIDGDGDLDIVFGGDWQSNKIWWWENPYPDYDPDKPWVRREIKNSGENQHHDQIFGDFYGNGKAELVSWNQYSKTLLLFEIPGDAKTSSTPWQSTIIYAWTGDNPEGLAMADIDGDGTQDIIGGGMWFKYDANTQNFTANSIDPDSRIIRVASGQWKKGGVPEVILSRGESPGRLKWYEYDRTTDIWTNHDLLGYDLIGAHSLQLTDINGDENLDIFVAEMSLHAGSGAKALILYGDGNGGILSQETVSMGIDNHESRISDLDGDGDLDILGKPYDGDTPRVDIWMQTAKSLDNWVYHQVDATRTKYYDSWYSYFGLSASNSTAGKCKDIVSGKYFYRNTGCNLNSPWVRSLLPVDSDGALFVNVDGDSDEDIIAFGLPYIYWFEATDANASAWTLERTITLTAPDIATDHRNPRASRSIDINNDGRPEILFEAGKPSTGTDGLYTMTIPSNPLTDTWSLTRLTSVGGDGFGVGDINSDGDLDVTIGRPRYSNEGLSDIYWYENTGSPGMWTGYNVGTTERSADRFEIADVDGDSRPDILISEETFPDFNIPGSAYWFKNPEDPGGIWIRNAIGQYQGYYAPQSMGVADMDGDGDLDVVLGEHQNQKRMFVLENNGTGNFTEHLIGSGKESHGLVVSDIDNDGDYDIIHLGWNDYQSLHLWENKAIQTTPTFSDPVISIQPLSQEVEVGRTVTFDVFATGTTPLSYQWNKNGTNIPGATNTSYTTPALTKLDNGSTYRVNVTNPAGSVMSNAAALTVKTSINLIKNGVFESGKDYWAFYTNGGGTFSIASSAYEGNNAFRLAFSSGGTNIQLYQTGITLEPNTRYRLSFAAYSTTGHDVTVRLSRHVSPYTPYMQEYTPNLGTSWQVFTTEFTTMGLTGTVNDGRFMFWLAPFAAAGDTYYIDDVRLEKVNSQEPTPTMVTGGTPAGTIVPVNTQMTVTFSEAMNQTSAQSSFFTSPATTGSFRWSGNNMTYTPNLNLDYSTTYTAAVGTGARDLAGNNLQSPYSWKFTTIASQPSMNIVKNPGFESGKDYWTFYMNGGGTFSIASSAYEENNASRLAFSSGGTNIQLYQTGITLEPNTRYRLSFAACSTTGHDVTVRLSRHVSPYTPYMQEYTPNLGTSWQVFTTEFTTTGLTGTVNDGRFMFWLAPFAAAGDTYSIDDVRLEKVNSQEPTPTMVTGGTPAGTIVPVNTQMMVTFSEAMNQTSAQSSFFTSPATTGSFRWSGNIMTYTPNLNLAYSTTYTAVVGTGARDLAGNNLQSAYSWKFTTIAAQPSMNIVKNPGFESGKDYWTFYTIGAGSFSIVSPGYEGNNASRFAMSKGGSNIQVYQTGVTLEPNTRYRLSFAAYSNTGHDVTVKLFKHVSPYNPYAPDFTANIGTIWQTFTTEFNTTGFTGKVNDVRLQFWLAPFVKAGDEYYIDDILLEKTSV